MPRIDVGEQSRLVDELYQSGRLSAADRARYIREIHRINQSDRSAPDPESLLDAYTGAQYDAQHPTSQIPSGDETGAVGPDGYTDIQHRRFQDAQDSAVQMLYKYHPEMFVASEQPGWWDKISSIAREVGPPMALELAEYATPVVGNIKTANDFAGDVNRTFQSLTDLGQDPIGNGIGAVTNGAWAVLDGMASMIPPQTMANGVYGGLKSLGRYAAAAPRALQAGSRSLSPSTLRTLMSKYR